MNVVRRPHGGGLPRVSWAEDNDESVDFFHNEVAVGTSMGNDPRIPVHEKNWLYSTINPFRGDYAKKKIAVAQRGPPSTCSQDLSETSDRSGGDGPRVIGRCYTVYTSIAPIM